MTNPPAPDTEAPIHTTQEVATVLRVDRRTVINYCQQGRFPNAFRLPGGGWRIPERDVVALTHAGAIE